MQTLKNLIYSWKQQKGNRVIIFFSKYKKKIPKIDFEMRRMNALFTHVFRKKSVNDLFSKTKLEGTKHKTRKFLQLITLKLNIGVLRNR